MGINATHRICMPSFRAAGVKQQIVEVPEGEAVSALRHAQIALNRLVSLKNDLAVQQQREKLDARETVLAPKLPDFLGGKKPGKKCGNLRIADSEKRTRQGRFNYYLIATPAKIGESRQDNRIYIIELLQLRPIAGNLRLDDDRVAGGSFCTADAIF